MTLMPMGIGWIIAVIFGLAALYYFLYNKRRKRVEIDWIYSNVIAARASSHAELKVIFNGREIERPHILTIAVHNRSTKDLTSKDFDSDEPLGIDIGVEIVSQLDLSDVKTKYLKISEDRRSITLAPCKLAKSSNDRIRLLVDGPPELTVPSDHPLIDTDIIVEYKFLPNPATMVRRLKLLLPMYVGGLILSSIVSSRNIGVKYLDVQLGQFLWKDDRVVGPSWAVITYISGQLLMIAAVLVLIPITARLLWNMRRFFRTGRMFSS